MHWVNIITEKKVLQYFDQLTQYNENISMPADKLRVTTPSI